MTPEQEQQMQAVAAMSELVAIMVDYPAKRDAKEINLVRRAPKFYVMYLPRFSETNGKPVEPGEVKLNRDGAEAIAKGLDAENARLLERIEKNKTAINNLRVTLPADMDALDQSLDKAA